MRSPPIRSLMDSAGPAYPAAFTVKLCTHPADRKTRRRKAENPAPDMISIRKYLDYQDASSPGPPGPQQPSPKGDDTFCALYSTLLESICTYVLSGDARTKIAQLRESLHAQLPPAAALEIQEAVRQILASHNSSMQDAATRTAVEMRHLVGILNQAVTLVANGGERAASGLQKIQDALQQTSNIPDFAGLRTSLAETIRLAKDESARQQAESARELAAIQTDIVEARQLVAQNPNQRLRGRPEGVRNISQGLQSVLPDHALYVAAFAFSNLHAVVQRYGPDAVEDVIFRLIRERIQPLAPANSAYRWTPQSLVGVFERPRDLARLRSEASALNRSPLVHRISLGNRIAVLTLSPSHLIAEGQTGLPEALIEEVDRFTGSNA